MTTRAQPTLKQLLKQKRLVRSLGAHDVFSALIAERSGFETIFVGGFGASASLLGMPDLGVITLSEIAGLVRRMAAQLNVPVVGDGDTGHGSVHNVQRTVEEFESAGADGVIIEDQVSPKRCGHFHGKQVIPSWEMEAKIRAAKAARKNPDFILIARTDARDTHGLGEAIRRVNRYRRAGADVAFIESPHTEQELALIPKKVNGPILVNMLTGGKTPNLPVSKLEKMGYSIVVYPIESLLITAPAIERLARAVLEEGTVEHVRNHMTSFAGIKEILGLEKHLSKGGSDGSR